MVSLLHRATIIIVSYIIFRVSLYPRDAGMVLFAGKTV